jgi:hypothetical protein
MVKSEKSDNDLLQEINQKLDKLIGILAIQDKDIDEQIHILKTLGFTSKETGILVGLDDSSIRHRKAWSKK